MKHFHQFCLTLALLLAAIPSMAAVTVRGTVTDETGQPVVGAGVVEVGGAFPLGEAHRFFLQRRQKGLFWTIVPDDWTFITIKCLENTHICI